MEGCYSALLFVGLAFPHHETRYRARQEFRGNDGRTQFRLGVPVTSGGGTMGAVGGHTSHNRDFRSPRIPLMFPIVLRAHRARVAQR